MSQIRSATNSGRGGGGGRSLISVSYLTLLSRFASPATRSLSSLSRLVLPPSCVASPSSLVALISTSVISTSVSLASFPLHLVLPPPVPPHYSFGVVSFRLPAAPPSDDPVTGRLVTQPLPSHYPHPVTPNPPYPILSSSLFVTNLLPTNPLSFSLSLSSSSAIIARP